MAINFFDFLLEKQEKFNSNEIQFIVLSNKNSSSKTIDAFEERQDKDDFKITIFEIDTTRIEKKDDQIIIFDDDIKPMIISPENTVVLARRGVVKNTYTQNILAQLESYGFYCVNRLSSIMDCENKFTTTQKLQAAGLSVPKTALVYNVEYLEKAVDEIGGKFPIILKLLSGTQGIGVAIIDSFVSLKSILQTIWALEDSAEVLIQEKIEAEYDIRVHVLCKGFNTSKDDFDDAFVLAAMKRTKADKDFRTNYSIGGGIDTIELSEDQVKLAINAAKVLGCAWCGVDIMVDKKTGESYILEVNASPGTSGITKATKIDVVGKVIEFLTDKRNWIRDRKEVGFLEVIAVEGIGEFVVKFDTGNSSKACSIHADEIEVDEEKKKVAWRIGNKTFVHDFKGWATSILGKTKERRALMELDLEFLGDIFEKVLVSPVIRHDKSAPFLANRSFMDLANLVINPKKVFILTEFPEYDLNIKGNMNGIKLYKK